MKEGPLIGNMELKYKSEGIKILATVQKKVENNTISL